MQSPNALFEEIKAYSYETQLLQSINFLTSWDQETYIPEGAHEFRSKMLSQLSGMIHERVVSPLFLEKLSSLIDIDTGKLLSDELSPMQKGSLREWRREYLLATKLPTEFVKESSQVTSKAANIWAQARKENNFSLFEPYLEKVFNLARKKADFYGYKEHPYDALLDEFEPYATRKEIDPLFSALKKDLAHLVRKIGDSKQVDSTCLDHHFPSDTQKKLGQELFEELFAETQFARLDVSTHPFCTSMHPTDVRLTTRIDEKDFLSNLLSVMHETGHALYSRNLPAEHFGTPAADSISLGIHESQSRWWETRVGRSYSFWKYFLPRVKKAFPELGNLSLDEFYPAMNKVSPSLIRVEADEVTYCLHIVIRYELEKQLLNDSLQVKDLPDAWNSLYEELLGITPPSDTLGCLQDVHWSFGLIGYFPTYALGNMYACQFFEAFQKEHPDWEKQLEKGEFSQMRSWLKEKVHKNGKIYPAKELVQKITGRELSQKPYVDYLRQKYTKIYSLDSSAETLSQP